MTTPLANRGNEQVSISFVEAVCYRPMMYTINGTLEEVGAFLEGFYSGMAAHNSHPAAQAQAQQWFDFCAWLNHRLNGHGHGSWYTAWKAVRQQYIDNHAGFMQIIAFYKEFQGTPQSI